MILQKEAEVQETSSKTWIMILSYQPCEIYFY